MSHELPRALQQARRINKLSATEESNVDVRREGVNVSECRITDARGRLIIMHHLADIVSTAAHYFEPLTRDGSQFLRLLAHPDLDRRISRDGT